MTRKVKLIACLGLTAFFPSLSKAALVVTIGDVNLLPNTQGQEVILYYENTGATLEVAALDFYVQVADGGPEIDGSSIDGPIITNIDLVTGTVFDGQTVTTAFDNSLPEAAPQSAFGTVELTGAEATVAIPATDSPSLKIATVTFDTSGFSNVGDSWDLIVETTKVGTSEFFDAAAQPVSISAENGSITLVAVPEPQDYALLFAVFLAGFALIRRKTNHVFDQQA